MRIHATLAVLLLAAGCGSSDRGRVALASGGPGETGEQAVVTASRGQVELLRNTGGSWSQVRVGDKVGVGEALRTGSGEADVAIAGVKVRLHESSGMHIEKIGKRQLAARVRGSIESEVDEKEQSRLDVAVEGTDAVAHSEGGHFFVTADGRGVVAVAAVTGAVHLSARGKDVEVKKGEVSRVAATGLTPSAPTEALRRVLLSVAWPRQRETNRQSLPLAGTVEPGSRVFVQGQPVPVESSGGFHADVPLKKGKQKVSVLTIDALGRRKQVENVVLRDDSLPEVKVKKKLWQWR